MKAAAAHSRFPQDCLYIQLFCSSTRPIPDTGILQPSEPPEQICSDQSVVGNAVSVERVGRWEKSYSK